MLTSPDQVMSVTRRYVFAVAIYGGSRSRHQQSSTCALPRTVTPIQWEEPAL